MAALLDTNSVSDLMRGHPSITSRIAQYLHPISTSVVSVGEIQFGLARMPEGKKRTELAARANAIIGSLIVEPVTEDIAHVYGELKAQLETTGLNLDDNDLWIAATAQSRGQLLVTRDQMFERFPDLLVADWSK